MVGLLRVLPEEDNQIRLAAIEILCDRHTNEHCTSLIYQNF